MHITIQELAQAVMKTVGFGGEIVFGKCQPNGTPCKLLE
ncbi:GDP-L-fucose synthase [Acidovorax soli]|uniref:GDP-L-fucose synthase n=1 Tax=Acidovorax soli TaxID=592050 RepID=A0A1H3VIT4_9BURK|nr:GDP-L-fucose synthase [Acidovorax soli]